MLGFKRGDSVRWPARYKVDGAVVDLTNYTVTSQVRSRDGLLICSFVVTLLDQAGFPGDYLLSLTPEVTSQLRPGVYLQDIQYTTAGVTQSTETVPCIIETDQTF